MDRRIVVAVAISVVLLTSGCVSGPIEGRTETDSTCTLFHETFDGNRTITDEYEYSNLTASARRVVNRTVDDGSYATTDEGLEVREFRYYDVRSNYRIHRANETYNLTTYSGCAWRG